MGNVFFFNPFLQWEIWLEKQNHPISFIQKQYIFQARRGLFRFCLTAVIVIFIRGQQLSAGKKTAKIFITLVSGWAITNFSAPDGKQKSVIIRYPAQRVIMGRV